MKTILITIAVLILAATYACAATKTLTVEYALEDPADQVDIHHANVYQEGVKVCSSLDNSLAFSCDANLRLGMRSFTITVETADGTQSAHSDPVTALVVPGKPVILRSEVK